MLNNEQTEVWRQLNKSLKGRQKVPITTSVNISVIPGSL